MADPKGFLNHGREVAASRPVEERRKDWNEVYVPGSLLPQRNVAIDPAAETERLRANRVAGKPPTEGDSPVITQRRQSVLQGFLSEVF